MEGQETPIIEGLKNDKPFDKILITPDLVLEWKKFYLREGHSFHSTTTYYNYIKRYVGYGVNLNQKSVDKFREKNMSSACSGSLKNFFQYLVNRKEFPQEILYIHFDKSKTTKKPPRSIEPLEVDRLIEAMPGLVNKNLTETIYKLGLRISEGLKLKWSDFNWFKWLQDKTKKGEVTLKNTKGGKFRTIPVPVDLMEKLYNDHKLRTEAGIPIGGLVFDYGIGEFSDKDKTMDENHYDYIVVHAEDRYRKLLYKVSKEVLGKRVNPHQLRHSIAMDMINNNVPIESIKRFLGHARISSTELYAQVSAEKLGKDLDEYYKFKNEKKQENNSV